MKQNYIKFWKGNMKNWNKYQFEKVHVICLMSALQAHNNNNRIKTFRKLLKILQDFLRTILWQICWKLCLVIWERKISYNLTEKTLQLLTGQHITLLFTQKCDIFSERITVLSCKKQLFSLCEIVSKASKKSPPILLTYTLDDIMVTH